LAAPARAEPETVLRLATVIPDGTPWALEVKAFARNVESGSNGRLRVKVYYNGVVGDEDEVGRRIDRNQLDGSLSSHAFCDRIAPSMRITSLPALFNTREEAVDVMSKLQPTFEAEAHRAGYALPAVMSVGPIVIFSRVSVRTMDEIRRLKLWVWSLDEVAIAASQAVGLKVVPLSLYDAAHAYDEGKVDGFFATPASALAFQWSARSRYLLDLRQGYLWGCLAIAERFYQRLPSELQAVIREQGAILRERSIEVSRQVDEELLHGLFEKQGVTLVTVTPNVRAAYFAASRAARERLSDTLIPRALINRVQQMLVDFHAENAKP
jgi:TRAP-type C4-dicarboxylate transport system substrate-binding protein